MIRTRFSPSPTGMLHLGNVRTALFSMLFAMHSEGDFILRIEDTDQTRSDAALTDKLLADLHWLGVDWQEGPHINGPHAPYWQSERHAIYSRYYEQLEKMELAYPCFCTDLELAMNRKRQLSLGQPPRYPGTCRSLSKETVASRLEKGEKPALRFRVPVNTKVQFLDLVKGPQHFNSDDIGDFIIRRADGTSSFLFCNAIDDSVMGITHVIRGEDHLANTPRQLMILSSLQMHVPHYSHLSLILGEDGAKLSKRHGSFSLQDLIQQGFLPMAIVNYLARLSHYYEEQHLMSLAELASHFSIEKISHAPARFDTHQLQHWQKEAVLQLSKKAMWEWLQPFIEEKIPDEKKDLFIDMMQKNSLFPVDARPWAAMLSGKAPVYSEEQRDILKAAGDAFFKAAEEGVKQYSTDLKNILDHIKQQLHVSGKLLFMPIRIALTGETHGPELIHIVNLLGEDKVRERFQYVRDLLRSSDVKNF